MVEAAVIREAGGAFELVDIELAPTGPNQVRVRLAATGVCHTDLTIADGSLPLGFPAVLGHEGAGVVTEVGEQVTRVQPGDRVVIAWNQPCRQCFHCARGEEHLCEQAMIDALSAPFATLDGEPLSTIPGAGTFARETLVLDRSVVPIGDDVPLEQAALIGCAVTTGVGAVLNTARPEPGTSVAVIGCGGVGLSAVQGARLAGAGPIVAVDVVADKLALAQRLGATDVIDASDGDPVAAVRALTGERGVDVAFEVIGRPATMAQAYAMARRGGEVVIVGAAAPGEQVAFDAWDLMFDAKTIRGSLYGSSDPDRDFPRFAQHAAAGELDLGALVSHRIGLDGVHEAVERMRRGEGVRSLVVFDD